jgi:hypothetical protein
MKYLTAIVLATLISAPSKASKPDFTTEEWNQWAVVGEAQLSFLFFDIYQSTLLTPTGGYQLSNDVSPHPLALSITYQRQISQQELLDATIEQWQKLGYSRGETSLWYSTLQEVFPSVEEGHQLTYVTNGESGQFYSRQSDMDSAGGQLIGQIDDESLNDAFLAIWLSPDTQYPKLRENLLGINR